MIFQAIDSLILAGATAAPYERLGWTVTEESAGVCTLAFGGLSQSTPRLYLADPGSPYWGNAATEQGLLAVGLSVADLDAALARLASRGIAADPLEGIRPPGAWLSLHAQAGANLLLRTKSEPKQVESINPRPAFPLKRLDHLAIVCHDLEEKTRFWSDVLDVPVTGEVATPTMVIRQLKIGDTVLELLGPTTPESPLWKRAPGLISMASWEVGAMAEAVRFARGAGFTVPDPAAGSLPGTRITTIPGIELGGVNMQLLEYV